MERSGSQKALLVISILIIIGGAIAILFAIMTGVAGGMVGAASSAQLAEAGVDSSMQAVATGGLTIITIVSVVSGAISLIEGILGIRAANDNQKIMPVWVLAIIGLAFSVIGIIMSIVNGGFQASSLVGLALSGLMFWIANNIKTEAGK